MFSTKSVLIGLLFFSTCSLIAMKEKESERRAIARSALAENASPATTQIITKSASVGSELYELETTATAATVRKNLKLRLQRPATPPPAIIAIPSCLLLSPDFFSTNNINSTVRVILALNRISALMIELEKTKSDLERSLSGIITDKPMKLALLDISNQAKAATIASNNEEELLKKPHRGYRLVDSATFA
jgi:hypothetical protein